MTSKAQISQAVVVVFGGGLAKMGRHEVIGKMRRTNSRIVSGLTPEATRPWRTEIDHAHIDGVQTQGRREP
jgi:hypothetical protein